jgi:hypothetical protein
MNYDDLRHGATHRLKTLRTAAAKLNEKLHRKNQSPLTWRDVRYRKFSDQFPRACRGENTKSGSTVPVLVTFSEADLPVRAVVYAEKILNSRHRGWFTDVDGDETARGIVAYISHGRYLSGYRLSDSGEHVLFISEIFDTEEDAAQDGDEEARIIAESIREDRELFSLMQAAEIECEALRERLKGTLPGRNASEYLRNVVHETLAEYRRALNTLRETTADYERIR